MILQVSKVFIALLLGLQLAGCGWMQFSLGDTAIKNQSSLKMKINDQDANGKVFINEGFGLIIYLSLIEAQTKDVPLFISLRPKHLTKNKTLEQMRSEYFVGVPDSVVIPAGKTSTYFSLSTLNDQINSTPNEWTLIAQSKENSLLESLSFDLEIIDDDAAAVPTTAGATVTDSGMICGGGDSFLSHSGNQAGGEFLIAVAPEQASCTYTFSVSGAGGGSAFASSFGGNGGRNQFSFTPGQAGVFRVVVGEGGALSLGQNGGYGGGGASRWDGSGGGGGGKVFNDLPLPARITNMTLAAQSQGAGGLGGGRVGMSKGQDGVVTYQVSP